MIIAQLLFYTFSAFLLGSALVVVTSRNPVYSVLFLIFAFFNSAGLFLLLGAEFIAMLMIIVYVGAVAVLFLFVVMMLDVDFDKLKGGFIKHLPVGFLVALAMLIEFLMAINASLGAGLKVGNAAHPISETITNTEALGLLLYTNYAYPFEIAGLILLVAMIGAIVLTLRARPGVKKQNISEQVSRSKEDCVEIVKVQSGKGV